MRRKNLLWVFVLAFAGIFFPLLALASERCTNPVETAAGLIRGLDDPSGVCAWKGVPYAAPPVGNLRWKRPQPHSKWEGVRETRGYGASCIQGPGLSETLGANSGIASEDCLFLNVWTPQVAQSQKLPVMVWIHGGAFMNGSGGEPYYDPSGLVKHGVTVVTINYRLGPFGFLALPELAHEDPEQSTGNYGMLDQVLALEWVRDNIAKFGGDPDNVTIFGESAGGASVCSLLGSPLAAGLFHKAIMQSGGCDMVLPIVDGFAGGASLAGAQGCTGADKIECLRSRPVESLRKERGAFSAMPHIDGYFLKMTPIEAIRQGSSKGVPVMAGSNKKEWDIFIDFSGEAARPGFMIKKDLNESTGGKYKELKSLYPSPANLNPANVLKRSVADAFGFEAFQLAEAVSQRGPAFYYRLDFDDWRFGKLFGTFHAFDGFCYSTGSNGRVNSES